MSADDLIYQWFEGLTPKRGKKPIKAGKAHRSRQPKLHSLTIGPRGWFQLTMKGSPQVMFKLDTTGKLKKDTTSQRPKDKPLKSLKQTSNFMDYITREETLDVFDEDGRRLSGTEALEIWQRDGQPLPEREGKARVARKAVISMPAGTDREAFERAMHEVMPKIFPNFQYVWVVHDDVDHVHAHALIKAKNRDGFSLSNYDKETLLHCRRLIAEALIDQGIEATATREDQHGIIQRAEHDAIKFINDGYKRGSRKEPARKTQAEVMEAAIAVQTGQILVEPYREEATEKYNQNRQHLLTIAQELTAGNAADRQLAQQTLRFLETMAPNETRMERYVREMKEMQAEHLKDKSLNKAQDQGMER